MVANPDFIYRPPMSPYLDIIYQDEDIVVINKPSGLLTVPGKRPEHKDSVATRVQRVLPTATIVHRLDMATSGILIMALNKPAHVEISRQFEKRETQKHYIARVYGSLASDTGTVDEPLICDWPNRPKQKVDHEHGKPSLTNYEIIAREEETSLVKLMPVTGRSHQLRVHMLSLGHPIIGDRLYAHDKALALSTRLQLHAASLKVKHPVSKEPVTFESNCPFNQYEKF